MTNSKDIKIIVFDGNFYVIGGEWTETNGPSIFEAKVEETLINSLYSQVPHGKNKSFYWDSTSMCTWMVNWELGHQ